MSTPKHSVSVAAVMTDDHGRALLIQRRDNHRWEPPGGVLELGETIQDGWSREVLKEAGLEIEPVALTGVDKNMSRGIIALVCYCQLAGGELAVSEEVAAFRWANESDVAAGLVGRHTGGYSANCPFPPPGLPSAGRAQAAQAEPGEEREDQRQSDRKAHVTRPVRGRVRPYRIGEVVLGRGDDVEVPGGGDRAEPPAGRDHPGELAESGNPRPSSRHRPDRRRRPASPAVPARRAVWARRCHQRRRHCRAGRC